LTLKLDSLQTDQGVEIAVRTKVKDGVQVGTRIVSQAEATFDGLSLPLHSNVVTVLIVGTELGPALPLIQGGTPSATPSPSATTTAVPPTATPTNAPTATAAATATPASPAGVSTAPLPATSQGIPISGFLLFGLTLLLRTVRLHRAQSRI
jgi:hypothetical protein